MDIWPLLISWALLNRGVANSRGLTLMLRLLCLRNIATSLPGACESQKDALAALDHGPNYHRQSLVSSERAQLSQAIPQFHVERMLHELNQSQPRLRIAAQRTQGP